MVEGSTGETMRELEQAADLVDRLTDMAESKGNRAIALLAQDAGETLLALLDGLAFAERRGFSLSDRTDASTGRRAGR